MENVRPVSNSVRCDKHFFTDIIVIHPSIQKKIKNTVSVILETKTEMYYLKHV